MTAAYKTTTITIAKSGKFEEGAYSYISQDAVRNLYAELAAISPHLIPHLPINRNGRQVGHIIAVRLIEHENGCFIEGDAVITDEQTVGVPNAYIGQFVRQSISESYKLTSEEEPRWREDLKTGRFESGKF